MLLKSIGLILILAGVSLIAAYLTFRPSYLYTLTYQQQTITVQRDQYNIPTIIAPSKQSLYYALGSCYAEDRLFQLSFRRLVVQGRLAQFLGPRAVQMDYFMRQLNLKDWGERLANRLQKQNATHYAYLQSQARGLNERVNKMAVLPIQFYLLGLKWQEWTVGDTMRLSKLLEWATSMNALEEYSNSLILANHHKEEADRMSPKDEDDWAFKSLPIAQESDIPQRLRSHNVKEMLQQASLSPTLLGKVIDLGIFSSFVTVDATNCWAVSGEHSETGRPILANDPHLDATMPSTWYQFRGLYQRNSKNYSFVGYQNVGFPILQGKSQYYAMGTSIAQTDNQDLFHQTVKDQQYLLDGQWKQLKKRQEIIKIKEEKGIRQQVYTVYETHRGPILHYVFHAMGSFKFADNQTISLAWTGFNDDPSSFAAGLNMAEVQDLSTLKRLMQYQSKALLNINYLFITKDDNLMMQDAGTHPIRRNPDSGNYIKDGSTSQHDWIGIVAPEDRINILNPKRGYIVNANNKIAPDDYYHGQFRYGQFTARMDRIVKLIKQQIDSGKKIGIDFANKIFYDTIDHYCEQILPELLHVLDNSDHLYDFDCDFTNSSYKASIYQVFMYQLHNVTKIISSNRASIITFASSQQALYNWIHRAYSGNQTAKNAINLAWNRTFPFLANFFKSNNVSKWQWGILHPDIMHHTPFTASPFLRGFFDRSYQGKGNRHTTNYAKTQKLQFGNFEVTNRANHRTIFSFTGQQDYWIIDGGSSQNILSKHYDDQWLLWKQDKMIKTGLPVLQQTKKSEEL